MLHFLELELDCYRRLCVGALEEQQCSHVYVCVFACGFVCMHAVPTEARKVSDLLELELLQAFVSHLV